jgi:hypothetical protein
MRQSNAKLLTALVAASVACPSIVSSRSI